MTSPLPSAYETSVAAGPLTQRLHSLDGLRGIAALAVVLHHALLVVPALAAPYYDQGPAAQWTTEWWLSHTPIHALWEGKAAVYVFFILSGFVLQTLVSRVDFDWKVYYPQRLLRLYLPVWGAVLFTVATFILVPRAGATGSLWLAERPETLTISAFVRDMTLILGNGGLASPLWSLRFEILFSLALPLYVWASKTLPGLTYIKISVCLAIITVGGYLNNTTLLYVPMFLIGTIMAEQGPRFSVIGERIGTIKAGWHIAMGTSVVLLASKGMVGGLGLSSELQGATSGITTLGAGLLVLAAIHWSTARQMLETKPARWLGGISFSLYLIHEPIVVASGFLFGPSHAVLAVVASIVVSLAIAAIFYKFVEKPSHKLSKKVGWPRSTR
jgi:peptidoglycan/LPS O-acetylase OafA/YrhL